MRVEGVPLSGAWGAGLGFSEEMHPSLEAECPEQGACEKASCWVGGGACLDVGSLQSWWGPH